MSNPLSMFRKYQYIFLVVFGVLLMVAFVVAPPLDQYLQSRSVGQVATDETIVTWNGGSLTERDLGRLRQRHTLALTYLNNLVRETEQRNGTPRGVQRDQLGRIVAPGIAPASSDRDLVENYLLAKKGEQMGLVVSEEAVREFLENLSDEQFLPHELRQIFEEQFGERFDPALLFEQLRIELLAQRVRAMAGAGLLVAPPSAVPPAQAWEYFQRLNRRAQFEVAALPVADFVSKVEAQPTEAQIQALYDEGKDRVPNPEAAEPGFRRRRESAFQYVKADFNKFVAEEQEKILGTITDDQIEQHYEQNKQRYTVNPESGSPAPSSDATPDTTPAAADGDATPPAAATPESAESPAPSVPTSESPAADAPAPADDSSLAEASDAAAADETATSDENPTDEPPASAPPPADAPPADAPPADAPSADTPSADTPSADTPSADTPSADTPPADAPPADTPPADAPASDAPAATADPAVASGSEAPADASPTGSQPDATSPGAPAAQEAPASPPIRPLDDELRAEIRAELAETQARRVAQERVDNAMAEVRKQVNKFSFEQRRDATRGMDDEPGGEELTGPIPGIEELASSLGLTADRMPMVDALEARDYELGEAFSLEFTSWPPQRIYFSDVAFSGDVRLYDPAEISGGMSGVEFLYWKTDDRPAYTPDLDEVRDEVVAAWKRIEARRVARAEAEKLQRLAAKADQPLATVLADKDIDVVETNEFAWMSTGNMPMGMSPPTVSQVDGVTSAGPDFMKAAFALQPGEVGVAMNEPQSIVYVLRMLNEVPTEDELRDDFLSAGIPPEVMYISYAESLTTMRDWYEDLEKDFGVKWLHDPDDLGS